MATGEPAGAMIEAVNLFWQILSVLGAIAGTALVYLIVALIASLLFPDGS